jgi:ubiquinone biosynthesis protein
MLSIKKIGVIGRTYRHLNRYRQILSVFFKYGFENIIEQLKIDHYIEIGLKMVSNKRPDKVEKLTREERIRLALEELGPTYIKLGQALSTRPDLISDSLINELVKLQDDVPPFPFSEAKKIIESELNAKIEKIFASIDEKPLASASIAQVHKASLVDGEKVAVKVQRPGIKKIIEVDLEIMLYLATLMERHIKEIAQHRPIKIVEEFARTLAKEVYFTIEASNIERFGRNFANDPTTYIPVVFREMTTAKILTMEFIDGIKISEVDRLEEAGLDRKKITQRGANLILKQIFNHGFFHADPHPGNIFVLPNNVICLVDFGMVGFVDRQTRENFVNLIDSVAKKDASKAAYAMLKITNMDRAPDMGLFEREVADFMNQHLYKQLKDIEVGKLLQHLFEIASHHNLRIPPDIIMMLKAIVTIEGIGLMLDPNFDIIAQAEPFVRKIKLDRYSPKRIADDILIFTKELMQFTQQFPKDMLDITNLVKQNKLRVNIEHNGLENLLETHHQISNRISFSIVIAALLIGSAILINSETPPLFFGISLIGIVGFITAAIMGFWLLVAIIKKGKL